MGGLAATLAILAVLAFPGAVPASPAPPSEPGELLVRFEPGASTTPALNAVDADLVERLSPAGLVRVQVGPATSLVAAEAALEQRPDVRYAEPNYRYSLHATPNDPLFSQLWGLQQANDADIDATDAWNLTTESLGVAVAVVDTGVAYTHPDLAANIVPGWDFFSHDNDPSDAVGHGTHVAGTIGAFGNNGTGVSGVNWRARLMPLRVGDASNIPASALIEAFDHACRSGVRIVNGSFGGFSASSAIHDAIARCPAALFVFSAGNSTSSNDARPVFPCNDPSPNVVCVAASNESDQLAPFSNYGSSVELAAPGTNILSTVLGNGYGFASGTSMAAPHVAGAAALVLARRPSLTSLQLRQALMSSADTNPALAGRVATGRLNVARALTQDVDPPSGLNVASTTPLGTWVNTNRITVSWSGALDPAGVGGYSYGWSTDPRFEPDETKDAEGGATTTTSIVSDGQQWFHIRASDVYGNYSAAKHLGPFLVDTFAPSRPILSSPTHRPRVRSAARRVAVTWASASDSGSGIDGFSYVWGRRRQVVVDRAKDVEEGVLRTRSRRLAPGSWWFGLRARDNAGNWTETVVVGPFVLTGRSPVCNVPRLRGLTLIGSKRLLVKRGCALGRITRAYSRRVARGRVIAQKRTPGLRLMRGAKVGVVLSRGRA
jgi:subtilisin family serine protease